MPVKLLEEIENEVVKILRDLIRINTTNPPGNELLATNYIKRLLDSEGFDCKVIKSSPKRANIITKIKGSGEKSNLLLLSHLDVVAANKKQWSVDPFEGLIKNGYVWGRGALDMKSMAAIELMICLLLKRNNIPLKGDLIFAATADEEKGGVNGVKYLMENHKETISADYVINEGGGIGLPIQDKIIFTVQNAEKGIIWFKVKTKGTPGHASMPNKNNNAILLMNKVIEKLVSYNPQSFLHDSLKQFLYKLAKNDAELLKPFNSILAKPHQSDQILNEISDKYYDLITEIKPRLKMTVTPTIIKGGIKENVIPSECETTFDCRILPGQSSKKIIRIIKDLLNDLDSENIELEILQSQEPTISEVNTELFNTIVSVLKDFRPKCDVTPLLMTGGTDSRFFRRNGSICYGFQPRIPEKSTPRIITREHGIDERISIKNLIFGTSVLYEIVKKFLC